MSFTTWVDARLAKFAPAVAAALMADDAPLIAQINAGMAANEKAIVAALPGAMSGVMTNLPAIITQAVKNALPFPL
jgi:hypothetical protein